MSERGSLPLNDFSQSILSGEGKNDYEKYIRTEALLSLQRTKEEWLHRDELLFQITHQSTELWLKLNNEEIIEATRALKDQKIHSTIAFIQRATECINLITAQINILSHLTPWNFLTIRPAFGTGSGMESPGWRDVVINGKELNTQFTHYIQQTKTDLMAIYTQPVQNEAFNLCEALIKWDEQIMEWRMRHYKMVIRTLGHQTVGTKGTLTDAMAQRIFMKFFPALWDVRTQLTERFTEKNNNTQ
ncbi:tryptophan 2,3-dioxygenase family protein [Providencia vermicola]|uniref:tryptophan 2,3-dioxygenase family protein n=1 Tax=Providencia vermicola TaxID=333965 RepID=UPI0032DB678A